jgi:hypothetical protein
MTTDTRSPRWYTAEIIEEITVSGDPRRVIHRNLILISAGSADEAYEKAQRFGSQAEDTYENPAGQAVTVKFRGVAQLDYLYEEPGDGAEVAFSEQIGLSEDQVSSLIPLHTN